ncbi:hypothetical protein ACFFQW_35995 [Umezawaea endophytica]|uniref:hypothetical protein n=1 Tax=Umezawaea endophytica TaxID=1654476 RepID=UPI0035ED0748
MSEHYDDPRYVVADVVAGEDKHGIWVSGALRYGVEPFQVMLLDRYSISGDWREQDLVAACTVSVPGFHLDADEQVRALAASGNRVKSFATACYPRRVERNGKLIAVLAAGVLPPLPSPCDCGPCLNDVCRLDNAMRDLEKQRARVGRNR